MKVNVYNATSRSGLAAKTAAEVRKRGFRVATVANDPLDKAVTATAEVRYGRSGTASSVLVIKLVKGAKAVPDQRTDSSVDLVLGDKFKALVAAPKEARRRRPPRRRPPPADPHGRRSDATARPAPSAGPT